jgi:phage tail tube protein FII
MNKKKDDELTKAAPKFDPVEASKAKWQSLTWIIAAIAFIAVGVAGTLGFVRADPFELGISNAASDLSAGQHEAEADVKIIDTVDETVVLLVGELGSYQEVKVAFTTEDTVKVQDVTRGQFETSSAALSPSQERLAYVREEADQQTVEIIDLEDGVRSVVNPNHLWDDAEKIQLEPCAWSQINWSTDSQRFAFFACYQNLSELIVIDAVPLIESTTITATRGTTPVPRQFRWIEEDALVYTQYDPISEQTAVRRIEIGSDTQPLLIYER